MGEVLVSGTKGRGFESRIAHQGFQRLGEFLLGPLIFGATGKDIRKSRSFLSFQSKGFLTFLCFTTALNL